jgi:hypothetical protein
LGTRGGIAIDLVVDLREGSHHSGHWGGLLADPGVILAHAIANIVSQDGRILVPGWTPAVIPNSVRQASHDVVIEDLPGTPVPDPGWGEPGLSRSERIYMWSSVIVLASICGQPEGPVNAVAGSARARVQIRHTVDVKVETIVPALRAHLDAHGLGVVQIVQVTERDAFPASRTDPDDPWVRLVARSMRKTADRPPNIIPNIGASGPSEYFKQVLGVPVMWIPHSYGGCGQHGPDEHGLGSLFRDGLGLMAGVFWDIGEQGRDAGRRAGPRQARTHFKRMTPTWGASTTSARATESCLSMAPLCCVPDGRARMTRMAAPAKTQRPGSGSRRRKRPRLWGRGSGGRWL